MSSYVFKDFSMKKFAVLTALCVLPMLTHSANWTPIFSHLEVGGAKGDAHVLEYLNNNLSKIPAPYRQDVASVRNYVEDGTKYKEISLKNATLYGLPIANYTIYTYSDENYGNVTSSFVTFKPMTNEQYQQLKRKKFIRDVPEEEDCGNGVSAFINKENGKVYLGFPDGTC